MACLPVTTIRHAQMVDITGQIEALLPADFSGAALIFCQHTTAGLTINENADPDVVHDMLGEFDQLSPWNNPAFKHGEGNSSAHVKATLAGSSVTVPVERGRMLLGTWQSIYLCEFDGPRSRRVIVTLLPGC
ncbi:MAG: secondary thiamine-phosphate synthase enzyme YjbQ [Lentisphaeria bacterium]|nr:secondary thiamine-phosphate synthase enzyme YjbQ [Lentisphaeria bacterium]